MATGTLQHYESAPRRPRRRVRRGLTAAAALWLAAALAALAIIPAPPIPIRLVVSADPSGVTSCFIGATEGNVRFDPADLRDLGLNTYRLYGGMSRWEREDDDGVYGSPSIAAIKADPGVGVVGGLGLLGGRAPGLEALHRFGVQRDDVFRPEALLYAGVTETRRAVQGRLTVRSQVLVEDARVHLGRDACVERQHTYGRCHAFRSQ